MPMVWKSPGIVKFVLLPTVGGLKKSPLRLVEDVPALRSRSLVVDIWLIVIDVAFRKTSEAGAVPAGKAASSGWRYLVFSLFTCESRSLTYVVVDWRVRVYVEPL